MGWVAEVTGLLLLLLPGFLTISQQFPPQVGSLEWLEWLPEMMGWNG